MITLEAVTLLCATVPLVEVTANENEAPCSVWRLAEVLGEREGYKHVSGSGAAKKVQKTEIIIIVVYMTQFCSKMHTCKNKRMLDD